jgi:hypothetical protein
MKNVAALERRVAEFEDALAGSMRQNQEQADEIARLKEEAAHRELLICAWITALRGVRDALKRALEPGVDSAGRVRQIIDGIEEQLRL